MTDCAWPSQEIVRFCINAGRNKNADPPPTVTEIATLLGVSRQAIYRRQDADRATLLVAEAS